MFVHWKFLAVVVAFLCLVSVSAAAEPERESTKTPPSQESQLHLEVGAGYQYFNPRGLHHGRLPFGKARGSGISSGVGAAYNLREFTLGLRFDQARTFPGSDVSAYWHWSLGPELGWLRRFDPFALHLAIGYAYQRMTHYYDLGGEYGGGTLTTLGHALRPSVTLRRSLNSHLYVGVRAQFEAIAFHRNNSGTFLCDGDYNCDPEQSKGLSALGALILGASL
jgi:opacity protein-like surface antigen